MLRTRSKPPLLSLFLPSGFCELPGCTRHSAPSQLSLPNTCPPNHQPALTSTPVPPTLVTEPRRASSPLSLLGHKVGTSRCSSPLAASRLSPDPRFPSCAPLSPRRCSQDPISHPPDSFPSRPSPGACISDFSLSPASCPDPRRIHISPILEENARGTLVEMTTE